MVSYVAERRGRLFFRMRVPQPLQVWAGCEILYPLLPGDLQNRIQRCRLLGEKVRRLFVNALRGKVDMKLLNLLVREICANILDDSRTISSSEQYTPQDYDEAIRFYQHCMQSGQLNGAPELIDYARTKNLELDPADPDVRSIILDYYIGRIETLKIQKERAAGNMHNGYDEPDANGNMLNLFTQSDSSHDDEPRQFMVHRIVKRDTPVADNEVVEVEGRFPVPENMRKRVPAQPADNTDTAAPLPADNGCKLSKAIDDYLDEKLGGNINSSTKNAISSAMSLLREILTPDPLVNKITRQDILPIWRDILPHLPSNRTKLYPGKTLQQLLRMKKAKVISHKTCVEYMGHVSSFFNWCVQSGLTTFNPAQNIIKGKRGNVSDERLPFTTEQLKQVFTKIGSMPDQKYFLPALYPFRLWIPFIGLYQGMR